MTALFFSAIIRAPAVFSFGIHMFAVAFGTITGRGETAFPEKTAPEISEVVEPGLKCDLLDRLAGLPQRPAGGGRRRGTGGGGSGAGGVGDGTNPGPCGFGPGDRHGALR